MKLTATGAKNLLWDEIWKTEKRYCEARDDYIRDHSPGPQVVRWFGLLEHTIAGNILWHTTSARYNKVAIIATRGANKASREQSSGDSQVDSESQSVDNDLKSMHKDPQMEYEATTEERNNGSNKGA